MGSIEELASKVLSLLSRGLMSIDAIAKELNINERVVKRILDYLIIRGFVNEIEVGPECRGRCPSCPLKRICPYAGSNINIRVKLYVINDKGRKALKEVDNTHTF